MIRRDAIVRNGPPLGWDDERGFLLCCDQPQSIRLIELGWNVLRFWVYQLRDVMPACAQRVKERGWMEHFWSLYKHPT